MCLIIVQDPTRARVGPVRLWDAGRRKGANTVSAGRCDESPHLARAAPAPRRPLVPMRRFWMAVSPNPGRFPALASSPPAAPRRFISSKSAAGTSRQRHPAAGREAMPLETAESILEWVSCRSRGASPNYARDSSDGRAGSVSAAFGLEIVGERPRAGSANGRPSTACRATPPRSGDYTEMVSP